MSFAAMMPAAAVAAHAAESVRQLGEQLKAHDRVAIAGVVDGRKYTIDEFAALFDAVKNPEHWKSPISATVPGHLAYATREAVCFYHGNRPRLVWSADGRECQIVGRGYSC